MKLRIEDDSLRLRLKQQEVARLRANGAVDCAIHFSAGRALTYSVVISLEASTITATYSGDSIRVALPQAVAIAWADSDQVTLESSGSSLRVLIEKDFQCLHKPGDPEAFPNPLAHEPSLK
jgi:hypothetical protein